MNKLVFCKEKSISLSIIKVGVGREFKELLIKIYSGRNIIYTD